MLGRCGTTGALSLRAPPRTRQRRLCRCCRSRNSRRSRCCRLPIINGDPEQAYFRRRHGRVDHHRALPYPLQETPQRRQRWRQPFLACPPDPKKGRPVTREAQFRFARDSPLEGGGFEPSVPRHYLASDRRIAFNQEGIFRHYLLSTAERPGVMATGAAKPTDQRGGDRPTNAEPSQNRAPG